MSVRIYQLSKEVGMDNAELIALLKDRGYEVKSASSTVDNISAASLREEFGGVAEIAEDLAGVEAAEQVMDPVAAMPVSPSGAIVRTREDIERERREREEEEQRKAAAALAAAAAARAPEAPAKPPMPVGKAPPPLPGVPPVQRRVVIPDNRGSAPQSVVPSRGPSIPVLRSDLPEEKEKPAAPIPQAQLPQTPAVRPPAVRPPPLGPITVAPPKVAPPKIAPPLPASRTIAVEQSQQPDNAEGSGSGAMEGKQTESAPAVQLKPLQVRSPIVVRDFALLIGRKPFQLISELMELSIFASMNSAIDEEVAERVARNHGFALEVRHRGGSAQAEPVKEAVVEVDDAALQEPRPPVVCILGHVDHGKTTLLDCIRNSNVVAGEAGGITQHVGAYQIEHRGKAITFIDTPGHAAFSNMRARGADVTDMVILVVAADDGFMPQTDEALKHARKAEVPVVVAINKIDAPGANIDKVLRQMQERSLAPEELGGETLCARISALKKQGIEDLLDVILLQAEVTEGITANPNGAASGVVIEAQKELGRGCTASVIVRKGTLKAGAALVCGENYCRVRQIIDDKGKVLKSAGPATPVKIVGWSEPPAAGDVFSEVKNEREAKREAEANELARKKLEAAEVNEGSASIEDLFAAIERTQKKTYKVLVKADVYGTAEALSTSLLAIKSDKIDLDVVDMGVGDITRNDISMASAAKATVVGFNVGMENGIVSFAKHHGVSILQHAIIYELIHQVKEGMTSLLEPEIRENKIGAAEVRMIFPLGKGRVAGCMVTEGRIQRDALARLMRAGKLIHQSRIGTLRRFKDDATEVRAGYECGVQLDGNVSYEERDVIEVFEILKIKPDL